MRSLCPSCAMPLVRACLSSTRVPIDRSGLRRFTLPRVKCGAPVCRCRGPFCGAYGPCRVAQRAHRQGERVFAVTTTTAAEPTRRDFLYIATGTGGAVGAAAVAWPLVSQMNPDASTIAAGAPIEVDLGPITEGQVIKVFWRSKPIFIGHRSKKEIEEAQKGALGSLADPQADSKRVKEGHEQSLVLIGICTHLGCIPIAHQGD